MNQTKQKKEALVIDLKKTNNLLRSIIFIRKKFTFIL